MHARRADVRRVLGRAAAVGLVASLLAGCAGYGGQTIGSDDAEARIQTDAQHCAITLPAGWTWYPAKWTAESPAGTQLSFDEIALGRPQNPDWEELRQTTVDEITRRSPDAIVESDGSRIRVDYGEDGGLSVVQRFDRFGCRLAFSNSRGTRAQEEQVWLEIIGSLERTSPTPNFTPPAGD